MKKKIVGIVVALIVIAAIVFGIYTKSTKDVEQEVMRIGSYYWPGQYWAFVAREKGFFKEVGLNVELVDTNANFNSSLVDVVEGRLDTQDFYLFDLLQKTAQGAELSMVVNADTSIGAEAIVARGGIKDIESLKGKKIGVEKEFVTEYLLYTILKQNKINLDEVDIEYLKSEELPERFINGELDAVVLWEPLVTEVLAKIGSSRIWDTGKMPGIISSGYVFRKEYIEDHPAKILAFVKVWNKTVEYMKDNPEEMYQIVAAANKDTTENAKAYNKINEIQDLEDNLKAFSFSGGYKSLYGQIKLINLYLGNQGIIKKEIDSNSILNSSFIEEIATE